MKRKPAQGNMSQTRIPSDNQVDADAISEPASPTIQPQTHHARRMQRRTLMMSVSANVGTSQSQVTPAERAVSSLQAGDSPRMAHSSPAALPEAARPSLQVMLRRVSLQYICNIPCRRTHPATLHLVLHMKRLPGNLFLTARLLGHQHKRRVPLCQKAPVLRQYSQPP